MRRPRLFARQAPFLPSSPLPSLRCWRGCGCSGNRRLTGDTRPVRGGMADDRAWSEEWTTDALYADDRNFYKVELWSKDGQHIDRLLYAGNNLDRAKAELAAYARKRPPTRLTTGSAIVSSRSGQRAEHGDEAWRIAANIAIARKLPCPRALLRRAARLSLRAGACRGR